MTALLLLAALACPTDRPATEAALADRVTCLERAERAELDAAVAEARGLTPGAPRLMAWVDQQTTLFGSLWGLVDAASPPAHQALGARLADLDAGLVARFAQGRAHLQQVLPLAADDLPLPVLAPAAAPTDRQAADSLLAHPDWPSQWLDFASWKALGLGELWDQSQVGRRTAAMGTLVAVDHSAHVAGWAAERRRALQAAQQHRRAWLLEGLALGE